MGCMLDEVLSVERVSSTKFELLSDMKWCLLSQVLELQEHDNGLHGSGMCSLHDLHPLFLVMSLPLRLPLRCVRPTHDMSACNVNVYSSH